MTGTTTFATPEIKRLLVLLRDSESKQTVPIGQLTHEPGKPYEFCFLQGVERARELGFTGLPAFPDMGRVYHSEELFSFFGNRLTPPQRVDYSEYLSLLCLPPDTKDEMALLGRSGGVRVTDSIELFAEPRLGENRVWEVQFWVEDVREDLSATVRDGAPLAVEGQHLHASDSSNVGKLPDVLHAAVESVKEWFRFLAFTENGGPTPRPSEDDLHSQMKLEVRVDHLAPKSAPERYRVLCLLSMVCPPELPLPLNTLGAYQPLTQVAASPRFVVGSERINPRLEHLLIQFSEGRLPELPTFGLPTAIRGAFDGSRLNGAQLKVDEDGKLAISGSDKDEEGWKLITETHPKPGDDANQAHRPQSKVIEVDLSDGARAEGVRAGSRRNFSTSEQEFRVHWTIKLANWVYVRSESVQYWIGVIREGALPDAQNLIVCSSKEIGWAGLHIPGQRSLTLLSQFSSPSAMERSQRKALVLVEANRDEFDRARERLADVSVLLQSTLALAPPTLFVGYDETGTACAAISLGATQPRHMGLTGTPRPCLFVPTLLSDWNLQPQRAWLAPWLSRLFGKLNDARTATSVDPSAISLKTALYYFRTVIEDPIVHHQVAKLGTAIRILLYCEEYGRPPQEYYNPAVVQSSLRRFCNSRRIRLPDQAEEAMDQAHRIALLGDWGLSRLASERTGAIQTGELLETLNTLRVTYASLLTALVGYHGPLFLQLNRLGIEPSKIFEPLLVPDSKAKLRDDAMASQIFQAGQEPEEL